MNRVRCLVLTGYGLNCDNETAHACRLAGADAERVHINALIDGSRRLVDYQMIVFVGGFSWGDDHGAGVIQAVHMRTHLGQDLRRFVRDGNLIFGICNGFQTLVNLGLLPGFDGDYSRRQVALTYNDSGNFRDQWVHLRINGTSPCIFTRGIRHIELPIRHGEGKFYAASAVIEKLQAAGQVVMQYAYDSDELAAGRFPVNPNGSVADIAGICDPTGRVFGLMPHPEAFNHPTNHPDWARRVHDPMTADSAPTSVPLLGISLFENAVTYLTNG
jgi:phosphoribosylformylglycinamidine synthase